MSRTRLRRAANRLAGRLLAAGALSLLLGGCLDVVLNPLNREPSAYEDSQCKRLPSSTHTIVNYGCVAGTELALRD